MGRYEMSILNSKLNNAVKAYQISKSENDLNEIIKISLDIAECNRYKDVINATIEKVKQIRGLVVIYL